MYNPVVLPINSGLTIMRSIIHSIAKHYSDAFGLVHARQCNLIQQNILFLLFLLGSLYMPRISMARGTPIFPDCQTSLDRTVLELKRIRAWGGWRNVRNGLTPSTIELEGFNQQNDYIMNGRKNPWRGTRDSFVAISVGETGAANVEKSPKFMEKITKDIISSCHNVALVKFWTGYEWGPEVGLLEDGSIKKFDCVDPLSPRVGNNIPWGKDDCCC